MFVLVVGGSGSGKSAYAEELSVSLSSPGMEKYYLATMQVFDQEGQRRVERHRALRQGKGFLTIEQPAQIHRAAGKMGAGDKVALLECISNLTANEMFPQETARPAGDTGQKPGNGMHLQETARPAGDTGQKPGNGMHLQETAQPTGDTGQKPGSGMHTQGTARPVGNTAQAYPRPCRQVAKEIIDSIGLLERETTHLVVVSNNVFEDGICYDKATMEYIRAMGLVNQSLAKSADRVVEVVAGIPVILKTEAARPACIGKRS